MQNQTVFIFDIKSKWIKWDNKKGINFFNKGFFYVNLLLVLYYMLDITILSWIIFLVLVDNKAVSSHALGNFLLKRDFKDSDISIFFFFYAVVGIAL